MGNAEAREHLYEVLSRVWAEKDAELALAKEELEEVLALVRERPELYKSRLEFLEDDLEVLSEEVAALQWALDAARSLR